MHYALRSITTDTQGLSTSSGDGTYRDRKGPCNGAHGSLLTELLNGGELKPKEDYISEEQVKTGYSGFRALRGYSFTDDVKK